MIYNSGYCLPELDIQAGFSKFAGFYKRIWSISGDSTFNLAFSSLCTNEDPRIGKPMDFTLEAEDEVIRGSIK